MNILEPESDFIVEAKIIGKRNDRGVRYSFVEPLNNYFLNKKEILLAQIEACKKLLTNLTQKEDVFVIRIEIQELESSIL